MLWSLYYEMISVGQKKFSCDQEGFCKHLVNKETVKFAWSNFWKEEYLANEILFLKIWFPVIQQFCLQWSLIVEWEHHDLGLLHHFSLKQDNLVLLLIIDKATTSKERIKGKKKHRRLNSGVFCACEYFETNAITSLWRKNDTHLVGFICLACR